MLIAPIIFSVIPVKGNSRRLPRKNLLNVWGKPMLLWAINTTKNSNFITKTIISTNSIEIAELLYRDKQTAELLSSRRLFIHERDNSLDEAPKQEVVRTALRTLERLVGIPDYIVSFQANSPQITSKHIDEIITKTIETGAHEIFSVDENLMQNAALRCMRYSYAFQRELSTHCGVQIIDAIDVHTQEDLSILEKIGCPHCSH